jgi:CheY-like chemotaxis protein
MDVMMPGLDGPSTLQRMREHALLAPIPIIFLTAKVLPSEIARFLSMGAIGVLQKPFDPVQLCTELTALWNGVHGPLEDRPPGAKAGRRRDSERLVEADASAFGDGNADGS